MFDMSLTESERNIFPVRLKKLRGDTPPSVLAELCGIRRNAIGEYETGRSLPGFHSIIKLADHFDVSVDFLLGREQ